MREGTDFAANLMRDQLQGGKVEPSFALVGPEFDHELDLPVLIDFKLEPDGSPILTSRDVVLTVGSTDP